MERVAEPRQKLYWQRTIESEISTQTRKRSRVSTVTQHHQRRIAGNEPNEQEHTDRDQQQGRERQQQPFQDVSEHGSRSMKANAPEARLG